MAADDANVVIATETARAGFVLPGTIYTAAEKVDKAGEKALPLVIDVRKDEQVSSAVKAANHEFGGIDILINNASAISITDRPLRTDFRLSVHPSECVRKNPEYLFSF